MNQDLEHLRMLSIFHYVMGGIGALAATFPCIHLTIGILLVVAPESLGTGNQGPPPAFLGWMFVIVAAFMILVGWTMAICVVLAGRSLARQTRYGFCFAVGCILCLFMPLGTILGVFTLIVLSRDSVKQLFEGVRNPFQPPAKPEAT